MLPSRSRLQGWNPESLTVAAEALRAAGASVYRSIRELDDEIDRMPEADAWSGTAHRAAADMFRRATDRSSAFKDYADTVATALSDGASTIGRARTAALAEAAEIDSGPLNVSDQWVVMIDAGGMSAERAAELEKMAKAAQAQLNPLVIAVDRADETASARVVTAISDEGINRDIAGEVSPGAVPLPIDDVPSPAGEDGRKFQEVARAEDMATTVRAIDDTEDRDGNRITTYTMMDGSTHVATEYIDQGLPSQQVYPPGTMRVLHSDKNGQWISETMTTPLEGGGTKTNVSWADGTTIVMTETADGVRTGRGFRRLASGFLDVRVRRYCGRGSSVSEVKPMFAVALVTAVCGTLGLFCAVWTFRLFAQGDYLTMLVVAGFMVFAFGLLAVRLLAEMGTVAPRIEYGDRGTILRPDPKVDRLSLIATFAAFASMLLYAVFGSLGMAKLPGPAGDQKWFVLSCIAGVVLGLPSLWRIASQGGMSYLRLSDSGLKIGDAYSRAEYRWDEVSEVSDLSRHRQWAHSAGSTYLATTDGRTRLLASDWFTPHGRALRCRFRSKSEQVVPVEK